MKLLTTECNCLATLGACNEWNWQPLQSLLSSSSTSNNWTWNKVYDDFFYWFWSSFFFIRFIIWRVGFWSTLKMCQKQRAYGRVSALCLTNEYPSAMDWNKGASSYVMAANNLWAKQTWNLPSGSLVSLALTVSPQNQKKRKREQGQDKSSLKPGELLADLIRVAGIPIYSRWVMKE